MQDVADHDRTPHLVMTGGFTAAGIMFLMIGLLGAVFGYRAGRNRIISA